MSLERSFESLAHLGWDSNWEASLSPHPHLSPARVAREDLGRYLLLAPDGERAAEISGRLRHHTRARADLPAVGDWVGIQDAPGAAARIEVVLRRRSAFTRKVPGSKSEEQVLAANVDSAFLISALDANLNLRRIERYLAAAWEGGAAPVIVLNKSDLADDLPALVARVEAVASGVPVVAVSALDPQQLDPLLPWLGPGRTIVLLGSSGVGKSTLVNTLLRSARQATGATRAVDGKGRHTTTRRELVPLPSGAVLIDTPGLRELQFWGEEDAIDSTYPEIVALAADCRFRDCAHRSEPACAVRAALEAGTLDASRLDAWRRLEREQARLERRRDIRAMLEERSRWKQITRAVREEAQRRKGR